MVQLIKQKRMIIFIYKIFSGIFNCKKMFKRASRLLSYGFRGKIA